MKLKEKIQYKLRNYLYERERQNMHKKQSKPIKAKDKFEETTDIPNVSDTGGEQDKGILGFFDEMEDYLGKQFDKVKIQKK